MQAIITGIVASPSRPSVRFTALPNADDHERAENIIEQTEVYGRTVPEWAHKAQCRYAHDQHKAAIPAIRNFDQPGGPCRTAPCGWPSSPCRNRRESRSRRSPSSRQGRPRHRVEEVHPQQYRNQHGDRIISPPIVGVPFLARWVCGPSERIGCPLPCRTRSQPMNFGPMRRPRNKAVATAMPARKLR
jgi:hypothetical protein